MKTLRTSTRICCLALAVFSLAPCVMAQHPEPKKSEAEGERPYEIFGGYSYLREEGHNLNGWTGTFIVNVNKWFARLTPRIPGSMG